ncbi:MAG: hypothetical protein ABR571_08905 [Jatrophihabitans sp.]|uniref:hypothetical protein n=1 Tax=Jatrophihabitans sp. TaxID=1932789 RepID=UPI003910251A
MSSERGPVFDITVDIPSNLDLGSLFCNVAKTIQGPSAAQGFNRKAGPACFRIGGDVRVVKTAAGRLTVTFVDPRTKNTTTISTAAKAATLGAAISDTATLTGATSGATGTITFKAYDTAEVHGNGDYASGLFAPTAAGSNFWVAAYSGDDANKPSTGTSGDKGETSVVTAPATSTPPSSTGAAPQGASQQPLANTGSSHVSNEMAWALALLILGAALTPPGSGATSASTDALS